MGYPPLGFFFEPSPSITYMYIKYLHLPSSDYTVLTYFCLIDPGLVLFADCLLHCVCRLFTPLHWHKTPWTATSSGEGRHKFPRVANKSRTTKIFLRYKPTFAHQTEEMRTSVEKLLFTTNFQINIKFKGENDSRIIFIQWAIVS